MLVCPVSCGPGGSGRRQSSEVTSSGEASFPKAGPAKLDLPAIVEGLGKTEMAWRTQKSWLLRYLNTREIINPLTRPEGAPEDREWEPHEMTNARKGKWLLSHEVTRAIGDADKETITPVHTWYVWKDGQLTLNRIPIRDPKGLFGMYSAFWYPSNLWISIWEDALPRPKDIGLPQGEQYLLPRLLKEDGASFVVRNRQEKIDGYPCYVIERKGKDIFWIDAERGFAVRRLNRYLAPGELMAEWKATGLRERAKGIWLPEKQVLVNYHPDGSGKIFNIVSNSLLEARFNDLKDDFFAIATPVTGDKSQR
jgi:hypothetical protein